MGRAAVSGCFFAGLAASVTAGCSGMSRAKTVPPSPTATATTPPSPTPVSLATVEVLATGQPYAGSLCVDASDVYWMAEQACTIRKVPKGGGAVSDIIVTGFPETRVAESGISLFFGPTLSLAYPVPVRRLLKSGGSPSLVATTGRVGALLADGSFVYGSDLDNGGGFLWSDPHAGGTPTPVSGATGAVFGLDQDASWIYYASSAGAVGRAAKPAGPATDIATGLCTPVAVAISGSTVLFSEPSCGRIRSVPVSGGTPSVTVICVPDAESIVADGSFVYFAARTEGRVGRAPIAGGAVVNLVTGLLDPYRLAQDAAALYVTERGAGRILRIVK